jgi:outer membrane lipoprotein SlyB
MRKQTGENAMQLKSISLRPLIIGATASVIVASAVGVAAVTGLIPNSRGQEAEQIERQAEKRAERQAEKRADLQEERQAEKAAARKQPVRTAAAKPAATPAATPRAAPVQVAQAPVIKPGAAATVVSVREVEDKGEAKGVGAIGGGVAGAVIGRQIGENRTGTILGGVGGAVLGHQIEKKVRATKHWETTVRLDDGSTQTLSSEGQPAYREGERVRVHQGALTPA